MRRHPAATSGWQESESICEVVSHGRIASEVHRRTDGSIELGPMLSAREQAFGHHNPVQLLTSCSGHAADSEPRLKHRRPHMRTCAAARLHSRAGTGHGRAGEVAPDAPRARRAVGQALCQPRYRLVIVVEDSTGSNGA